MFFNLILITICIPFISALNPCDPSPCNSGNCLDNRGEPVCRCPRNFKGNFCELEEKNGCDLNPCMNDGVCRTHSLNVEKITCDCPSGFYGSLCETSYIDEFKVSFYSIPDHIEDVKSSIETVDYCAQYCRENCESFAYNSVLKNCMLYKSIPSKHSLNFNPLVNFYYKNLLVDKQTCLLQCSAKCLKNPCKNSGECFEGYNKEIWCKCPENFHGRFCELEKTSTKSCTLCKKDSCKNWGKCFHSTDKNGQISSFCLCIPWWTGRDCSKKTREIHKNFTYTGTGFNPEYLVKKHSFDVSSCVEECIKYGRLCKGITFSSLSHYCYLLKDEGKPNSDPRFYFFKRRL
jgi:hypothetical protein